MVSLALVILAAICKAIADTLQWHYDISIFHNWDSHFWNPAVSWQYASMFIGYRIDGWHLGNSGMIICFLLAVVLYKPFKKWWIDLIIGGTVFNVVFGLFFKIFA